ncbi:hypothetical protein JNO48_07525 [Clostridiales bacterium]|nr:hypothetical protein JNO48_07525 [Clostridiales bacterium]
MAGKLRRIISTIRNAPDILERLSARMDHAAQQLEDMNRTLQEQGDRLNEANDRLNLANDRQNGADKRLDEAEHALRADNDRLNLANDRQNGTDKRLDEAEHALRADNDRLNLASDRQNGTDKRLDQAENELRSIRTGDWMIRNPELLRVLNREMSIQPTVWGNPDRIRAAKTAAVDSCLFNTNSGTITIGEYSFAGSRVSLLAGSHDPELTGFLRRDAEETEGYDIVIGNGVWMASGCTILGPCTIGDNAVIAAGAVVVPGTEVPANTIFGGVPAKQIGTLAGQEAGEGPGAAVIRALARNRGVLFTDGWSEKAMFPGIVQPGYWLEKETGTILLGCAEWRFLYGVEGGESAAVHISDGKGFEKDIPFTGTGEMAVTFPYESGYESIRVTQAPGSGRLFLSTLPGTCGKGEEET